MLLLPKFALVGWHDAMPPCTVNSHTDLPVDMTQRIKICKYYGSMCTGVLNYTADTLRDDWNLYALYGNVTYPNPGQYAFEKPFLWPDNRLSDFPWAGLSFDIVVDIQAEDVGDTSTHMRCHAPFTTVNYDTFKENGSTGGGFAARFGSWSVSMIGIVGIGATANWFRKKKRRQQPILTLEGPIYPEEEPTCTAFEMMSCSNTGGDTASARV